MDEQARQQAMRSAERALDRMEAAGITSGQDYERLAQVAQTGSEHGTSGALGWLGRLLGYLDRPGQLVRYAVADIFDIGEGENITGEAYLDVLLGRHASLVERYGEEVVGDDARMSGSQLLKLGGWDEATTGWGKFARGLASIGTELALDPLTYAWGGGGAVRGADSLNMAFGVLRHKALPEVVELASRGGSRALGRAARRSERLVANLADDAVRNRAGVEASRLARFVDDLPAGALDDATRAQVRGWSRREVEGLADWLGPEARRTLDGLLDEAAIIREASEQAVLHKVDLIGPRVMGRDWAHPDMEDFVTYAHTPPQLRGGIHVSPRPILPLPGLWRVPGKAWDLPLTRGLGKKITRGLLGRSGQIAGEAAKGRGPRLWLEKTFPKMFHLGESMRSATDFRAYYRGVLHGDVKASTVIGLEAHVKKVAEVVGTRRALQEIQRSLEDMVDVGKKAGWSERQMWEVVGNLPARVLQEVPAGAVEARSMIRDALRGALGGSAGAAAAVPDDVVNAFVRFGESWRSVMAKTHAEMVRLRIVRPDARVADYFPMVRTPAGADVLGQLARRGVEFGDSVEERLLAELVSGVRPRGGSPGMALGEAEHAQPRTFGAFLDMPAEGARTTLVDASELMGMALRDPEVASNLLLRQLAETVLAGGRPALESIDELNRLLTEGVRKVLARKANAGKIAMPRGATAESFRMFDTNPLTVAEAYLRDTHSAIVEAEAIRFLRDIGEIEVAQRVLKGQLSAHMIQRRLLGVDDQAEKSMLRVAKRVSKGSARQAAKETRPTRIEVVPARAGAKAVSVVIPARAASGKVVRFLKSRGGLIARTAEVRAELERATARVSRALRESGMDDESAEILALAASDGRQFRELLAEAEGALDDSAAALVADMAHVASAEGADLADVARQVGEVLEVLRGEREEVRRLAGRLSSLLRERPVFETAVLTGDQVLRASDEVLPELLGRVNRAAALLGDDPVGQRLVMATGRLIQGLERGEWAGLREAAADLDDALGVLAGREVAADAGELRSVVAGAVRRHALTRGGHERISLMAVADEIEQMDPADALYMLGALPPRQAQEAVTAALLAGMPFDPDMLRTVTGAAHTELLRDLSRVRDQLYAVEWVMNAKQAVIGNARQVPPDILDLGRLERGLREVLSLPDDVQIGWGHTMVLTDGKAVRVWGPIARRGMGRVGINRAVLAGELADAGLSAEQARLALLDPAHLRHADASRLSPAAQAKLLTAPDEVISELDVLADHAARVSRLRMIADGEMGDAPAEVAELVGRFYPASKNHRRGFPAVLRRLGEIPAGGRAGAAPTGLEKIAADQAVARGHTVLADLAEQAGGEAALSRRLREGGVRFWLSDDETAGFAIDTQGELFALFNVGEKGLGRAAVRAAREAGATSAVIPAGRADLERLFAEVGLTVKTGEGAGRVRLSLLPATARKVRSEVARHARVAALIDELADLADGGKWKTLAARLAEDRTVKRLLPAEQFTALKRTVDTRLMVENPAVSQLAKDVARASDALVRSMARSDRAQVAIVGEVARLNRMMGDPAVRAAELTVQQVETARTLCAKYAELLQRLNAETFIDEAAELEAIKGLRDEVVELARGLGWKRMEWAVKGGFEHGIGAGAGQILPKAIGLGGEQLAFRTVGAGSAAVLASLVGNMQRLGTPEGLAFLSHQVRSVYHWWKGMATVVRPTFHVRNLIGGVWNNMIGFVGVKDYIWVRDKLARFRHYEATLHDTEAAIARMGKDAPIIRAALESGVLNSSFARAEAEALTRPVGLAAKLNPLSRRGPAVRAGGAAMTTVEDFLRMAAFHRWYEYGPEAASAMTFALHFDYRNLTPLEHRLKVLVPFFVWSRRNLPLQLRALVERPDLLQKYQHLLHGFNDQADVNAPYDIPLPGMFNAAFSIETGMIFNADTPFWARAILTPDLPITDLAEFDPMAPSSWLKFGMNMLGPQVSLPFELQQQAEYGGSVNAPAGLNEILMGLHALGIYDEVSGDTALIPREMRRLIETLVPPWREWTGIWETDPGRRQALGLGRERQPMSLEVLRALGLLLGRGVGLQTVTPTRGYSGSWAANDLVQEIVKNLEQTGVIPPD